VERRRDGQDAHRALIGCGRPLTSYRTNERVGKNLPVWREAVRRIGRLVIRRDAVRRRLDVGGKIDGRRTPFDVRRRVGARRWMWTPFPGGTVRRRVDIFQMEITERQRLSILTSRPGRRRFTAKLVQPGCFFVSPPILAILQSREE